MHCVSPSRCAGLPRIPSNAGAGLVLNKKQTEVLRFYSFGELNDYALTALLGFS
jgi:hypothetical protein